MQKKHIIALTGYAGTGKDTVADLMVTHLGFRKLAFADALRGEIAEGFSVDPIYLSHPSTKNHPITALALRRAPIEFLAGISFNNPGVPREADGLLSAAWLDAPRSPRQIMQWWGTEYRRAQHPRYWTRIMGARIAELQRAGWTRFVITDCRFDNEADTVYTMGGLIWQITRPGIDGATTSEGNHISVVDGSQFKPAAVIANTHDLKHLQQLVLSEFMALESGIPGAQVTVPV